MKQHAKGVILFSLLIIIGFTYILLRTTPQSIEESERKDILEGTSSEGQSIVRENRLSAKEIEERLIVEKNGEGYVKHSLDGKGNEVLVTFYRPDLHNESIPVESRHGGILVYRREQSGIKKLWESKDRIFATRPTIQVRDITGDGNSEILALWSDGKFGTLYVYSWTGSTFELITPLIEHTSWFDGSTSMILAFGADDGEVDVGDLDDDGIEEVVFTRKQFLELDSASNVMYEFYKNTYKWNGEEYFLWKEEKIGGE